MQALYQLESALVFDYRNNVISHTQRESLWAKTVIENSADAIALIFKNYIISIDNFYRALDTGEIKTLNTPEPEASFKDFVEYANNNPRKLLLLDHINDTYVGEELNKHNQLRESQLFSPRGREAKKHSLIRSNSHKNITIGISSVEHTAKFLSNFWKSEFEHAKSAFEHNESAEIVKTFRKQKIPFIGGISGTIEPVIFDLRRGITDGRGYHESEFETILLMYTVAMVAGGQHSIAECIICAQEFGFFSELSDPRENYEQFIVDLADKCQQLNIPSSPLIPRDIMLAIEGGGTTFTLCTYDLEGNLLDQTIYPTQAGVQMLEVIDQYIATQAQFNVLKSIGIATFGPFDVNPASNDYGIIHNNNRHGWLNVDFYGYLNTRYPEIPIKMHNDLCAAAMAEYQAHDDPPQKILYFSVATGVGAVPLHQGKLDNEDDAPELGHTPVLRIEGDVYLSDCEHECIEGFASGQALIKRYNQMESANITSAAEIPHNHPILLWAANYIAQGLINILQENEGIELIIISGKVLTLNDDLLKNAALLFKQMWRKSCSHLEAPVIELALLGEEAGPKGALHLAKSAYTAENCSNHVNLYSIND